MFERRVVISGGEDTNFNELKSVECYDLLADEWVSMPSTINQYRDHRLLVYNLIIRDWITKKNTHEV